MSLDSINSIDAIGIESETGVVVLTIADSWGWSQMHEHLLTLQNKLNAYLEFIEAGQIWNEYPAAVGRQLRINVVFRFSPPASALQLLSKAAEAAAEIKTQISHEVYASGEK
jgi:hypothetical protein